jgi:glutathione S-transferase
MRPTIVADYKPESFLVHWLVLEKECPLDVVTESPIRGAIQVKAPYYEDGDILIYDLPTLVQFLQERYPGEQLLPADPVSRAQIRQACTLIGEPDIDLITEIDAILDTGSQYMAGREFTLLDIYIGTWMAEYVLENDVSAAVYEYWKRISSRAAFRIAANVY